MMMNFRNRGGWRSLLLGMMIVGIMAGCAVYNSNSLNKPAAVLESIPGLLEGYLSAKDISNSLVLLPPPPATGSAAFALDEEISRRSFALRDTPRWLLAGSDADLYFPHAAGTFSCALNAPITQEDTPHLYLLLRRTLTDLGISTYAAKNNYKRTRPFLLNKEPICAPNDQAKLEKDGSYPSGHTAAGWGWALILVEISPDQTDAILVRGLAFGHIHTHGGLYGHSIVWSKSSAWRDCPSVCLSCPGRYLLNPGDKEISGPSTGCV